jgi:ABC-type transport system involved in multi-copper enzyme maturation permease subunit
MLGNLFLGEWRKINGNRTTTTLFIWSAPIGAFLLMGLIILSIAASETARENVRFGGGFSGSWSEMFLGGWQVVNNEIGRYVIAAFTAIVFAGEYQFGTWKNFVPYRRRTTLFLNKLAVIAVMVIIAWVSMTIIVGIGFLIVAQIGNVDVGTFDGETVRAFAGQYALQMALTLTATLIAACYAALAAMFTRSMIASFFVAVLFNVIETGILLPLALLYQFFRVNLLAIYTYTPSFNLANIQQIIQFDRPVTPPSIPGTMISGHSFENSLIIIVIWLLVLLSITLWRFNRQDIVT